MERATKVVTTAGGTICVLKTYLTFEEAEIALKIENKFEQSAKLVELALVSLGGKMEDAYARARQLPVSEYTEIAMEVSKSISGNLAPAK